MIKVIFNVVILILFMLLMVFNMNQNVEIILFTRLAKDVPLSFVMVVSFSIGILSMIPSFFSYKRKIKRKLEEKYGKLDVKIEKFDKKNKVEK